MASPVAVPLIRAWRMLCAMLAAAWLLAALPAGAQSLRFPELSGRVVDAANILPTPARERLETRLRAHEDKTSDQVVVATVPSLQETSIEDFANQLFRHWKLGQQKTNNGVLVLVAPAERKVRIEVGYGLEGSLTDAVAQMIIQAAVAPKFKTGDYGGGVEAGVEAIVATLQGDGEWQERVKLRNAQNDGYDPMTLVLLVVIIIIVINIIAARSHGGGGGGRGGLHRRRGGEWVVIPSSNGWGGGFSGGGSSGDSGGFSGGGGSSGGGGASGDW